MSLYDPPLLTFEFETLLHVEMSLTKIHALEIKAFGWLKFTVVDCFLN